MAKHLVDTTDKDIILTELFIAMKVIDKDLLQLAYITAFLVISYSTS